MGREGDRLMATRIRWAALPSTLLRDASAKGLSAFVRLVLVDVVAGSQVTALPGLTIYSPGLAAEELQATSRGVEKALVELVQAGLIVHDRAHRVVWSVASAEANANGCRNPAQVSGWIRLWTAIPECAPKRAAREWLFRMLEDKGPQFSEAFAKFSGSDAETVSETVPETVSGTVMETALTRPAPVHVPVPAPPPDPHLQPDPSETPEPATRRPGELARVAELVAKFGDPGLVSILRNAWAGPDLDVLVEQLVERAGERPGLKSPVGWIVSQVRKLRNDPEALAAWTDTMAKEREQRLRDEQAERDRKAAHDRKVEAHREGQAAWDRELAELHERLGLAGETPEAYEARARFGTLQRPFGGAIYADRYRTATGRDVEDAIAEGLASGRVAVLPTTKVPRAPSADDDLWPRKARAKPRPWDDPPPKYDMALDER